MSGRGIKSKMNLERSSMLKNKITNKARSLLWSIANTTKEIIWQLYVNPWVEIFGSPRQLPNSDLQSYQKINNEEIFDDAGSIKATLNKVIFFMGAGQYFQAEISPGREAVVLIESNKGTKGVVMIVNLINFTIMCYQSEPTREIIARNIFDLHQKVKECAEDLVCTRVSSVENLEHLHAN